MATEGSKIEEDDHPISQPFTISSLKDHLLTFFQRYCVRYCCCCQCCQNFFTKKIFPNDLDQFDLPEQDDTPISGPKEISDQIIIRKFVQKWEGKFWKKFWKDHEKNLLKQLAATKIQAIIRGYLGRRKYERQYAHAIYEMNEFWRRKRELKLLEKEKQRIAKEVRGKVISYHN